MDCASALSAPRSGGNFPPPNSEHFHTPVMRRCHGRHCIYNKRPIPRKMAGVATPAIATVKIRKKIPIPTAINPPPISPNPAMGWSPSPTTPPTATKRPAIMHISAATPNPRIMQNQAASKPNMTPATPARSPTNPPSRPTATGRQIIQRITISAIMPPDNGSFPVFPDLPRESCFP